jgi:hypothetical protein
MVSGLMSRKYKERLIELGLTTLEERRHQVDMLLMYKIVHGGENLPHATWFRPHESDGHTETRGPAECAGQPWQARDMEELFSARVGEVWKAVPVDIKRASSANSFKNAYSKFRQEMIRN